MRTEGQVDIQRFKKELLQKQMAPKIPKDLVIKNSSPARQQGADSRLSNSVIDSKAPSQMDLNKESP